MTIRAFLPEAFRGLCLRQKKRLSTGRATLARRMDHLGGQGGLAFPMQQGPDFGRGFSPSVAAVAFWSWVSTEQRLAASDRAVGRSSI